MLLNYVIIVLLCIMVLDELEHRRVIKTSNINSILHGNTIKTEWKKRNEDIGDLIFIQFLGLIYIYFHCSM